MQSGTQKFIEEFSSLVRARYPLIYLQSFEEQRALELVGEMSVKRSSAVYVWSRTQGVYRDGKPVNDMNDPLAVLRWYEELNEKSVLILKDYHPFLKEPAVIRKLRDLVHVLKKAQKNVVILSPVTQVPPELSKEMPLLELPLPSRAEIETLVRKIDSLVPDDQKNAGLMENVIDAATGLTFDEIENVLAKSLVRLGKLDKKLIQDEKRQIVKRSGLLEFVNHDGPSSSVGGLHLLKQWLHVRRRGFSKEARDLGLPVPKGILLVGVPGCGKSLTAVTVGREWELPLLRLDMGRIFSGLVGSSESNIRSALATCEAVAPCVLWVDEIEKGLSGSQSSGSSDGGTTSRVFGTILTWMQEKKAPVFVVATANDISQLPPEFLRKGRFDEIFFVDLPNEAERNEIFNIQFERYQWSLADLKVEELIQKTDGFSGAEIEQAVVGARYLAFGENAPFSQEHLLAAILETVPLSKTMADKIEKLRTWATHRARPASSLPTEVVRDQFRARTDSLELGMSN